MLETSRTNNSYIRYSTKISQIEYQNISYVVYYVPKYISNQVPHYIRLHTKIFGLRSKIF